MLLKTSQTLQTTKQTKTKMKSRQQTCGLSITQIGKKPFDFLNAIAVIKNVLLVSC